MVDPRFERGCHLWTVIVEATRYLGIEVSLLTPKMTDGTSLGLLLFTSKESVVTSLMGMQDSDKFSEEPVLPPLRLMDLLKVAKKRGCKYVALDHIWGTTEGVREIDGFIEAIERWAAPR